VGAGTLINLHSHTTFSDGAYPAEVIVRRAVEEGITHIAITDHLDTAKVPSLPLSHLEGYASHVRELARKFDGTIEVLVGVEIDAAPSRSDLLSFPAGELNRLDLVLFEYIEDPLFGGAGFDELAPLLRAIRVPKGMAHVDVERVFGHISPGQLTELLVSWDMFMEANTAGPYRRDGAYFFERAEEYYRAFKGRVGVSVGADTHRALPAMSRVRYAHTFLERVGLLDDLIVR